MYLFIYRDRGGGGRERESDPPHTQRSTRTPKSGEPLLETARRTCGFEVSNHPTSCLKIAPIMYLFIYRDRERAREGGRGRERNHRHTQHSTRTPKSGEPLLETARRTCGFDVSNHPTSCLKIAPIMYLFIYRDRGGVGLYTILPLPILYAVWLPQGGSDGGSYIAH